MYEDLPAFYAGDYGRVRGQHYDIVLNGVEIGGGSVRIHDPEMQEHTFQNVLQVSNAPPTISVSSLHHSLMNAPAPVCGPFRVSARVYLMFPVTSGHPGRRFDASC